MNDENQISRPIWLSRDGSRVQVIDQRLLPHEMKILDLTTVDDTIMAIKEMVVRGAPLIGVTAAYGMYLAALNAPGDANGPEYWNNEAGRLAAARPTAVNLAWAVNRMAETISAAGDNAAKISAARKTAADIAEDEVENCRRIGQNGLPLVKQISDAKDGAPVNILTHCNAGWLACVEYGTATAPVYIAWEQGIDVHVWVDETRPLNQGARLTSWELGQADVPHTLITDNAGGHLMQRGQVDLVIVGTDRTSANGDVANKIGTYLKALAARDNGIPFYVALPSSTFDWKSVDGLKDIPIEQRDAREVYLVDGHDGEKPNRVRICPPDTPAANPAFDVTPARLVTGLITERGVCGATLEEIKKLFPEKF
jgi:methylthioribose-1-phosphate isomerase